jgi:hypothetical protein
MAHYAFILAWKQPPESIPEEEFELILKFFKAYRFKMFANQIPQIWVAEDEGLNPVIRIVGRIPMSITRHLTSIYCTRMSDTSGDYIDKIGAK